jgi:hypothetical protein
MMSNIKFHQNLPRSSRVEAFGRAGADEETGGTDPIYMYEKGIIRHIFT